MRDALYVRASTDEQAKSGYSIPDQLREPHRHADSNGYKVVDTLADDGYSGPPASHLAWRRSGPSGHSMSD